MEKKPPTSSPNRAFSLVEISIVLVIIGLLIGGITLGRSMVRAAELRSVMTDANAYLAAIGNFRQQYRYLPGDAPNAISYWPTAAGNGNADGLVTAGERFLFWQHLSLAGFATQTFTGVQGAGGSEDFIIDENIPNSRIKLAGFGFYYANLTATTSLYTVNLGNSFTFGKLGAANSGPPTTAVFTPVDAATIDTKMDDGRPSTGKWVANLTGGGNFGTATACTTDANGTTYTGTYRTTNNDVSCSFFFMSGY